MEEKQLTEKESLQLIGRMVYEAKGYYYESGIGGLVYGFSVFSCSLLYFFMEKNMIAFPFQPVYLLVPVFFIQGWIQYKEEKKKKAKTFTDEAIDYVWLGFFIAAIISLGGIFAGANNYNIVTVLLFLVAFAAFLTGAIAKFRYHILAAFICWALAAASFFMSDATVYLLLAAAAVLVWVIPGFILNGIFRKQHP